MPEIKTAPIWSSLIFLFGLWSAGRVFADDLTDTPLSRLAANCQFILGHIRGGLLPEKLKQISAYLNSEAPVDQKLAAVRLLHNNAFAIAVLRDTAHGPYQDILRNLNYASQLDLDPQVRTEADLAWKHVTDTRIQYDREIAEAEKVEERRRERPTSNRLLKRFSPKQTRTANPATPRSSPMADLQAPVDYREPRHSAPLLTPPKIPTAAEIRHDADLLNLLAIAERPYSRETKLNALETFVRALRGRSFVDNISARNYRDVLQNLHRLGQTREAGYAPAAEEMRRAITDLERASFYHDHDLAAFYTDKDSPAEWLPERFERLSGVIDEKSDLARTLAGLNGEALYARREELIHLLQREVSKTENSHPTSEVARVAREAYELMVAQRVSNSRGPHSTTTNLSLIAAELSPLENRLRDYSEGTFAPLSDE
jgi:hypothetical protein